MIKGIWNPTENIFVDFNRRILAPAIPKSAYSTLKSKVFYYYKPADKDYGTLLRGEITPDYADVIPNDFDCIVFIRDPLERMISGLAEVMYRSYNEKYGSPDRYHSGEVDEYILDFIYKDKTKNLKGLLKHFTSRGGSFPYKVDVHLKPQTLTMDWTNLSNSFSNITMFDVNKNLWSNLTHWMNARKTPIVTEKKAGNHINSSFAKGFKSYVRGVYTLAFRENQNDFLDDYKEYYKLDIDFYNTHKAHCYKGGES